MPVRFRKRLLADTPYEAASVFDIDGDGVPDIVSGAYWWKGPDFVERTRICEVEPVGEYHADFGDLPLDITGNGWPDIVTGAWFDGILKWREHPGDAAAADWKVHEVENCGNIETLRLADIDGCGTPEVLVNTPGEPMAFWKLDKAAKRLVKHTIGKAPSGHGMGWGDIAGNGRVDIVLAGGWLEAPPDPLRGEWRFHEEFDLGCASVPVLVHDVTGNGMADLIWGNAHDYGLFWMEQGRDASGRRTWTKHTILYNDSQLHDLQLADLDGDGELELVTGKRYRAHNDNDPGAADPLCLYYFKIARGRFEKHQIDRGPAGEASGAGIHFAIADTNGDGRPDIVAPGKDGLYLFENLGNDD